MDKYIIEKRVGTGAFGDVFKARNKRTNETVAIKRMKKSYNNWNKCIELKEVVALRKFNNSMHIIKLKELLRENNILYFIFEYMDGDLLFIMRELQNTSTKMRGHMSRLALPLNVIQLYTYQIVNGLKLMHTNGFFHRDLKPENILIMKYKHSPENRLLDTVKLADLGLAKQVWDRPPFTEYVSTRWYRAPELLLHDSHYNSSVDMWALGCIIVEMITGKPIFPGTNEIDQILKIISIIGAPTVTTWPEGLTLANQIKCKFPLISNPISISSYLTRYFKSDDLICYTSNNTQHDCIDFISKLLILNPKHRLTTSQALQHQFLNKISPQLIHHLSSGIKSSDISKLPDISKIPDINKIQDISKLPDDSKISDINKIKDISKLPDDSKISDINKIKDISKLPDNSKISDIHKLPNISKLPDDSKLLEESKLSGESKPVRISPHKRTNIDTETNRDSLDKVRVFKCPLINDYCPSRADAALPVVLPHRKLSKKSIKSQEVLHRYTPLNLSRKNIDIKDALYQTAESQSIVKMNSKSTSQACSVEKSTSLFEFQSKVSNKELLAIEKDSVSNTSKTDFLNTLTPKPKLTAFYKSPNLKKSINSESKLRDRSKVKQVLKPTNLNDINEFKSINNKNDLSITPSGLHSIHAIPQLQDRSKHISKES